jgi:hypothetical protein
MELPIGVRSFQSRSLSFSQQQLVNVYPEGGNSGTKSQILLVGTPGTKDFGTVGNGPSRGMEVMNDVLYVVSGTLLYSVTSGGVGTSLGTIPGTGLVSIANNGTQLVVVAGGNGYLYNRLTAAFAQITDADFSGADTVTFIDGFFIFNDGSRLFSSDLNDGTSYNALSFTNENYDPDITIKVFADHSELWVYGPNAIIPWFGIGGAFFPYAPRQGVALETGLISKNTVAKLHESKYWFGIDRRGGRKIYRSSGYAAEPISTTAVEKKLDEAATPENAIGFAYSQEGHHFYVLTIPGEVTFVYDATTGEFHERRSWGDDDWRMQTFVYCYNKRLVGDFKSGKIYELDLDTYTEDAGIIERIVTSGTISSQDGEYVLHDRVQVDFDGGIGNAADNDPQCSIAWVNDGQLDFINYKTRSIGAIGEYSSRVYWNRLGRARSRIYRLRMTDPNAFRVKGAYYFSSENGYGSR